MIRPNTDITMLILALVVIANGVTTDSSLGRRPSVADLLMTPFFAFDYLPGIKLSCGSPLRLGSIRVPIES